MAKKNVKIETPGAGDETASAAHKQVSSIQDIAVNITEAIALNREIIDSAEALEDEKDQARVKMDALLAAQEEVTAMLDAARASLSVVQQQAQAKAAAVKKTDMSNIKVNKRESKKVTGPGIELTPRGYVIKPRNTVGVKE